MVRQRGTSEIELLVVCLLLIVIMNATVFCRQLGSARLGGQQIAAEEAFHDATQAAVPVYADDAANPPTDGFASVRPGLPNRLHVPHDLTNVALANASSGFAPVTLKASAALAGPSWTYPAYPDSGDEAATSQWFLDYVAESHQELVDPLGLAPPWTP